MTKVYCDMCGEKTDVDCTNTNNKGKVVCIDCKEQRFAELKYDLDEIYGECMDYDINWLELIED